MEANHQKRYLAEKHRLLDERQRELENMRNIIPLREQLLPSIKDVDTNSEGSSKSDGDQDSFHTNCKDRSASSPDNSTESSSEASSADDDFDDNSDDEDDVTILIP